MLYPRGAKSTVVVTLPSGQTVDGTLAYQDEFTIGLKDANGTYKSWSVDNVKFKVDSPVEAHVEQFPKYTDDDVHNLMAYLQTLTLISRLREIDRRGFLRYDVAAISLGFSQSAAVLALTARLSCARLRKNLEPAQMLHPSADSWPNYHGDYSGQRHSRLTQITPQNVGRPEPRVGFSDQSAGEHQVFPAACRRHSLLHRARQYLGSRRAIRAHALALQPSHAGRPAHRPSRPGDVQGMALLHHARCSSGLA